MICGQILSQDRHRTVSTALRNPKPQPNIAVTSSAVDGAHRSSGIAATPISGNMPKTPIIKGAVPQMYDNFKGKIDEKTGVLSSSN